MLCSGIKFEGEEGGLIVSSPCNKLLSKLERKRFLKQCREANIPDKVFKTYTHSKKHKLRYEFSKNSYLVEVKGLKEHLNYLTCLIYLNLDKPFFLPGELLNYLDKDQTKVLFSNAVKASLLLISGLAKINDEEKQKFAQSIVEYRQAHKRKTLVITN